LSFFRVYPSLKQGLFMKKALLVIRMQFQGTNFARSGSFSFGLHTKIFNVLMTFF